MATNHPTGDPATDAQAKVNGIVQNDRDKQSVPVHTFNPDSSPQQKAAAAGKDKTKLDNGSASEKAAGAKAVSVSTGHAPPAIPPTITITDADNDPKPEIRGTPPAGKTDDKRLPGALPEGPAPTIPDWYKVGWRSVGGIDNPAPEGSEKDKAILDLFLSEQYYGSWYHNAAVIFFAVFASHILTLLRFGWGWLFVILAFCATYYSQSMVRLRHRAKDDIQRELVKHRLLTEHESAEWINNFLDRFWLIYEPVLSETVVQSVDQVLSENCPPFLESIRLSTFTLGTKAPRIEKVRTFANTDEDIVMMDWGMSFTPSDISDISPREAAKRVNPKIVLQIRLGKGVASAGMPILLEDINFSGLIRVRLKLMTKLPHVQLVDISFLEKPQFDYVLKPIGGDHFGFDIGYIPGLSTFIRDMVHANLGPMMYDPNVFTLNLEQLLAGAPLDTSIGVLQVTVHNARGLKGVKIGGGTPDPYVSLSINQRAELAKTKWKTSTYNPTWNETKFLLINSLTEVLCFSVLDFNEHRKDSEMGVATFDLTKLQEDPTLEDLEAHILKDGKERGTLNFDLSFYPVLKPETVDGKEQPLPDTRVGIVRLTLHQCKDLDSSKSVTGELNPFAKVLLSANAPAVHETKRVKHTNNPVWESSVEFLCSDKHSSVITVKIVDDREFLKDPLVGFLSIRLEDLLEAKKVVGRDWWPLSGCKSGRLRMSAEWKPLNMAGSLHGTDQYVPPIGVVRLWIQKATEIKNVEAALGGKSDPYVRVQLNNVTVGRTDVINNNLNPEWDQIIYIPVHSLKEVLILECMDYQNLTKDRTLGTVEQKVSELARRSDDPQYPFASTGKREAVEPIHLDKHSLYKGNLYYVAEFVPAIALSGVSFESGTNEIDKVEENLDNDTATSASTREAVPDGVTATRPFEETGDEDDEEKKEEEKGGDKKTHKKGTKSVDSAAASVKTAETTTTDGGASAPRAVQMSKEELLKQQSGILVINVRSGELTQKARLEVLLDDSYWPSFSTIRPRSAHAQWDHVGEGFIKELDFGRVWLRLNRGEENEKDDVVAELKLDSKTFLDQTLSGPFKFTLMDQENRNKSVVELESRYVPVPIKLEARESINNMGTLRVDLVSGHNIKAVDRGGKSDPFVVFTLNGQKVYKSQTKKKTLSPEWNENFAVQVPSRVAADFSLEVFDWNQIEQAKTLGVAKIDLAKLDPFEAMEKAYPLSILKQGDHGEIRLKMVFIPEIIAKQRKNTSTFAGAERAMTSIGAVPLGVGKGIVHGVGKVGGVVGGAVGGVIHKDHSKSESVDSSGTRRDLHPEDLPMGAIPQHVSGYDTNGHASTFPSHNAAGPSGDVLIPNEPGTLRVSILSAEDLPTHNGEAPKQPYVIVKVGDKEQKTKHEHRNAKPEWNETFSFSAGPSTPKAHVSVLDHKSFGKDKPIGEAEVDIWRYVHPRAGTAVADVPVKLRGGQGTVHLRCEFENTPFTGRNSPFNSPSRFSLSRRTASDE